MVKHVLFPNLRGKMLLLCFVLMFCLRLRANTSLHIQKVGILNVFCHLNTTPMSNSCKLMVDL